ncbi:VanZ family protein [Rhodospirillum sp. A1_3_36]|uniref:VanZ family protein n=1 Tax=Rhodospirillum sp. A1_3_36 TaxID=3391666 RepID=UPI0039A787D6
MTLVRLLLRQPPQWLPPLIAGLLMVSALVGSLLPQMGPPGEYGIDKMVHVLGYAALAFALGEIRGLRWPWALILALVIGGGAELLQTAVPERDGSWGDFFAGGLGAALGVAVQVALTQARVQARTISAAGGKALPLSDESGKHP